MHGRDPDAPPKLLPDADEVRDLTADEPAFPSKHSSHHRLPRASAVDLRHRRIFPSPLGEQSIHHRAAGAAVPQKLGHRRRGLCVPLDP